MDDPGDTVMVDATEYLVFRYTQAMQTPRGPFRQRTSVIGVSNDGGRSWTFANGDLSPDLIRQILPALPANITFSPHQMPVVGG